MSPYYVQRNKHCFGWFPHYYFCCEIMIKHSSTKMAKLLLLVILVIIILVNEVAARGGGSGQGRGRGGRSGGNGYVVVGRVPSCGKSNHTCGESVAASKFGYSHYNLVFVIVTYFLVYAIL